MTEGPVRESPVRDAVLRYVYSHVNTWLTIEEIAEGARLERSQVGGPLNTLVYKRVIIRSTDPGWRERQVRVRDRRNRVFYRTKAGYMLTSTFAPRRYPEAIFVAPDGDPTNEMTIVGPFCVHCGNPHFAHGPGDECLNYRIHPLLPTGDLPAVRGEGST